MDLQLEGKTALVTGGSQGLGFATAMLLVQEGVRVAINSRDAEKLRSAEEALNNVGGAHVITLKGDVSDPLVPEKLVNEAAHRLGSLDILIANAGGPPSGGFESFDDAAWQKAIELCFMGPVRLIRAALPFLRESNTASVLTVTSYAVKQPIPNLVLSNSVRAATVGLTKTLALELGCAGIRFNSILPAWTETDRIKDLMQARAEKKGTSMDEEIRLQALESPFSRMARPEEFAKVAVFLVSPAASYITGVMLPVDGGMLKGTL